MQIIRILNQQRQPVAILDKAFGIGYKRILNDLWTAHFTLPIDDVKNAHCKPLNYVEITDDLTGEYIGLFRIIPSKTRKLSTLNEVNYNLEHILSTLLDDVLFKYHQRSNLTTRANIEYVLARQTTKHWRLGDCEFTRYFHYKWENENGLLGPLFSISQPFDEPYVWTFDTQTYPWTINLVSPSAVPSAEIRFGKNLAEIEREVDPSNIVNRLYALGYGEGVNQLTFEKVNGGRAYIENTASIAEYGLGQYVWVDRRFEDDASLLASAKAFLEEWSVPHVNYTIKAVELTSLTGLSIDQFTVGKVVRVIDPEIGTFTARIVTESKPDIYGDPGDIDLEIANTKANVGTSIADVERRQEINEVYAQGATNMLIYPYEDNADAQNAAVIRFKLPDEMVRINKLELTYEISEFRAYSRAIEGGGAIVSSTESGGATTRTSSAGGGTTRTSSSGGGTTATSTSGGGVAKSTAAGGASTQTSSSGGGVAKSTANGGGSTQTSSSGGATTRSSSAGGDHNHRLFVGSSFAMPTNGNQHFRFRLEGGGSVGVAIPIESLTTDNVVTDTSSGNHTHSVTIPAHTHNVSIPSHTHSFDIPNHTHSVSIPSHRHDFEVPNHSHNVTIQNHTHDTVIPNHTHTTDIPAHKHEIILPNHAHSIDHGIFKLGRTPSKVTVKVDGKAVPLTSIYADSFDIIPFLAVDDEGRVQRGWHTVEILPNDLGRINAEVMTQFFMQSRGGVDV